MMISDGGILVRTAVKDVSVTGRNTQGVRLIKLGKGERLTQIERIAKMEGDDDELDEDGNPIVDLDAPLKASGEETPTATIDDAAQAEDADGDSGNAPESED